MKNKVRIDFSQAAVFYSQSAAFFFRFTEFSIEINM